MNGEAKILAKSALNVLSMITVPIAFLSIPKDPLDVVGWYSLLVGVLLQIVKYYAFKESQSGALTQP